MPPPDFLGFDDQIIEIPIPEWGRVTALKFAQEATVSRAKQLCINTLAVCAVKEYLQRLGYRTDLIQSQCWSPIGRELLDVADLTIVGKGVLECRAIAPGETHCPIPLEARSDRLGYVILQLDLEDTRQTQLLGFTRELESEAISAFDLEPMELFPHYLETIQARYQLSQWFEDIVEAGWRQIEDIISPIWIGQLNMEAAARSGLDESQRVRWVRAIEVCERQAVALVVTQHREADQSVTVTIEAFPCGESAMPDPLRLVLLNEIGESIMETEVSAPGAGLHFSAGQGETFDVELRLLDSSHTEHFAI
ncbi:MAG: DUF1822 family protein [Cyanobacteria bacterium P01_F01_bin.42]